MNKAKLSIQNPKPKIQNRKVAPARSAAFQVLLKIEREKAFSSVLLPLYEEKLSVKDRALCHELTLGVLRKQIYLDEIVKKLTGKKIEKLDFEVHLALRLALYQIFFTDKIPAFSAINESVNLVRRAKKVSAAGFVNAVLRRATREKIEFEFADEIEKISIENSFPRWIVEKWAKQFGLEGAKNIVAASNQTTEAAFRLTAKADGKTIEILEKIGLNVAPSAFVSGTYKVSGSNEILRLYADEGKIYFQDEGSQMVAQAVNLQPGESFLDVCAAPGSKFTLVSSNFKVQSSKLFVAGDLHLHRLRVLKESAARQGLNQTNLVGYNAEKSLPFADESFDVALVDAPCTGTGTIRHNPEIRYFLRKEDLMELPEKQLAILKNASKLIKSGGRIIYSTCSLEPEENEFVCERFLTESTEFQKMTPALPERFLTAKGFARIFPDRDGMDGFFIAAFQRK